MEDKKLDIESELTAILSKEPIKSDTEITIPLGFNNSPLDLVDVQADRLQKSLKISSAFSVGRTNKVNYRETLKARGQTFADGYISDDEGKMFEFTQKIDVLINPDFPPQKALKRPFFGDFQELKEIHKRQLKNIVIANKQWKLMGTSSGPNSVK